MLSSRLRQLHSLLFYALILLLPTQLGKHFWPEFAFVSGIRIDYLSPTLYLTDIILVLLFVTWIFSYRKSGEDQVLSRLWLIMFGIYVLSNIFLAISPWVTIFRWIKYLELGLFVMYVSKAKFNLDLVKKLLVIGGMFSALLALAQFYNNGSLGGGLYWLGERSFSLNTPGIARQMLLGREYLRPYATFPHPNVLAGYFVVTLPFVLSLHKAFRLILAFLWIGIIYLSGSIVALIVGVGMLFQYIKIRSLYKKYIVFGLFIFIVGFLSVTHEPYSLTRRIELNSIAYRMFKDSPIVGIGMNNFVIQMSEYGNLNEPGFFYQPTHNIYFLLLAEGGIIGFALFIWIMYKIVQSQITNYKLQITKNSPPLLSLIALLFLGFFDHYPLTLQQGQLLFALVIGLNLIHK